MNDNQDSAEEVPKKVRKHSLDIVRAVAKNISEGAMIESDVVDTIDNESSLQKGKVDVFMQAVTSYQVNRLTKYLGAIDHLEEELLSPRFIDSLSAETRIELMQTLQKHFESMTKFIDSKSSTPLTDVKNVTINMDNRQQVVNTDNPTNKSLEDMKPSQRQKIRTVLSMLEQRMKEPVDVPVKPVEVKKIKIIRQEKNEAI